MPIYDFRCQGCQKDFEKLVLRGELVECPSCRSREILRLLSRFGVKTRERFVSSRSSGCQACKASSCTRCP